MPANIHEHLELTLHVVEVSPYESLNLVNKEYPNWILSHVLSGQVEMRCGEQRWQVRAGDVMLHPPHLPFSELSDRAGTHQWMRLDVTVAHYYDLFQLHPVALVVSLTSPARFSALFNELLQLWSTSTSSLRDLQASALAIQLCGFVLESWQAAGGVPRAPELMTPRDRFMNVIKYMATHMEQKLTRDILAEQVHLHPGYFDRVFVSVYGVSPMQMLRDMRLRRALSLLESSDASLAAIAHQCGLGDAGYFSRIFRQRYGETPGQYRQSVKNAKVSYIPPLSQ